MAAAIAREMRKKKMLNCIPSLDRSLGSPLILSTASLSSDLQASACMALMPGSSLLPKVIFLFLDRVAHLERPLYVDLKFVFIFWSLVIVLPSLMVKQESIFSSTCVSFGSFELILMLSCP